MSAIMKRNKSLNIKDLEVGKTYLVNIEDCCVSGDFTSKLKEKKIDKWYEEYGTITFENSVFLDTFWGCVITEAKEDETKRTK